MSSIELRVARVVDHEALARVLAEHGIDAEPLVDEAALGFKIPCEDGEAARGSAELLTQIESLLAETGLPLVPVRGDGFVFLGPPGD